MAANISEINIGPEKSASWMDRVPWFYPAMLMVVFFSFFRLGQAPLNDWDEAHIGINAMEMLQNGDWFNRSLGGEPDYLRTEPPLVVWMVATNFSLFGPSAFSLRLHSAIATLLIFFFLFRMVQLYRPPLFAFGVCLIMLSVGESQIAQDGGSSTVLMAFLFGGLYFFLRYLDFMRYLDIYFAAVLWGLAFWVAGFNFVILFPSILLYLILNGRLRHVFRLREVYKAIGIILLFPAVWYALLYFIGPQGSDSLLMNGVDFETDKLYFIEYIDQSVSAFHYAPMFFLGTLLDNFSYWFLLFCTIILAGIARKFIYGLPKWEPHQYRLALLAICVWLPLTILAHYANYAFLYIVLAIPFMAVTTMTGIWWISQRYAKLTLIGFCLFWVFCLYQRGFDYAPSAGFLEIEESSVRHTKIIDQQGLLLSSSDKIYQVGSLPNQSVLLNLYFTNPNIEYSKVDDILANPAPKLTVFMAQKEWKNWQKYLGNFTIVDEDEHYLILERF